MNDVTRVLSKMEAGDPTAAEQLLPLVYDELRRLAAAKLAHERPGQTLQATALVHEAYVRLVAGRQEDKEWDSRGHFYAAAAEAMRRILVDSARKKKSGKHGGDMDRIALSDLPADGAGNALDLLALNEALESLETEHPEKAQVVKLRFFAGLTLEETAALLGASRATTQRNWAYARAWLFGRLKDK